MRLDINLASQPYEDARLFWMRWGTAVGTVGILTLILLTLTITGWFNARRDHVAMAQKRALIADRDQKRAQAESTLNLPQNRNTRDTSQFLNQLIERKAFSWTRVLESLEQVMPPRVHLMSISPGLDEDNQLSLKMTVAGDSRDRAIELERHMEDSRRFAQTQIVGERPTQSTSGDTEQFDILAIYVPETLADLAAKNTPPAETKAETKPQARPKMEGVSRPKQEAPKGKQH
jgi:Tfp pilus assembly protein PilN